MGPAEEATTMSLFITVVAIASLLPALYAVYGEIENRLQHGRLSRELGRAFSK